jgi:hypothetical protein
MSKIVALSKYGFKVDSLRNDWEKVDKSLLHRDTFNLLEKGLEIQVTERNKKGFILDFKVLHHKDQGEEVTHNISNNSSQKSTLNTLTSKNSNSLPASLSLGSDILERDATKRLNPQFELTSKTASVQDNIRYAQAVNIAFHCLGEIDLSFQDGFWIKKGFDNADLVYEEFVKRCKHD